MTTTLKELTPLNDDDTSVVESPPARGSSPKDPSKSGVLGGALLTPVLLFFVVLNVVPTLWLIGLGFYRYTLGRGDPEFNGFENFTDIFGDREVWGAFSRTFTFMLFAVGIQVVLGVALGLLFWGSAKMPGRRVALTMLFTPMVMAPIASGLFWRLIYEPTFGVLNHLLDSAGFDRISFLTDTTWAFPAVVIVDIWMWTPFMILMTLAALGSVPDAELEAAEIDRLGFLERLRYVIWPHGKFILMLGVLLRTIDAFKTTDLVLTMTQGGPGNKTELVGVSLFRQAFNSFNLGSSSALGLVLLIIAIALTSVYLHVLNLSRSR